MYDLAISILKTFNGILMAGVAITAFSLLLYALSFNLRDRVARSFALILVCVVIIFSGEALSGIGTSVFEVTFWMKFQWVGILVLPAAYFHFSDALLETTGRPSRGRRRMLTRINYLVSMAFILALPFSVLVGPLVENGQPAPHLEKTGLIYVFIVFFGLNVGLAWWNMIRAFQRTTLPTSRRRMQYLLAGALAPVLGGFPFLLFGFEFAAAHRLLFWMTASLSNFLVTFLLVIMAYAVAFFGVPWPDRVVKRRLFKWLMRGPVTAGVVLALTTFVSQTGQALGLNHAGTIPLVTVVTIVLLEHLITLVAPVWERYLFHGGEQDETRLVQTLEERMLTTKDLRQFLDAVLAAVCDLIQTPTAFVAAFAGERVEFLVSVGSLDSLPEESLFQALDEIIASNGHRGGVLTWGTYWLVPLRAVGEPGGKLLGLLGVMQNQDQELESDQRSSLIALADRAALSIEDRNRQQEMFSSLQDLTTQVGYIQRLRAASRYNQSSVLKDLEDLSGDGTLFNSVRDALSHYWGGPKLADNPLLELEVVRRSMQENGSSPVNALRSVLKEAVERVKPEGERRFTGEWLLYNILDLKFLEGRRVREVARRLAMSEADLYRKQKVAIEEVARAIRDMEYAARERES
ncbi:MAG TPA: histidine kinase N-terminal 7TM domain-containing protein [Anaerolineales bacterium]|nr:histidine kinase N-terminal 7TM domain-containing protein [Anaerolineales bacterium]